MPTDPTGRTDRPVHLVYEDTMLAERDRAGRAVRRLAEAARDARRLTPASGLGLDTPAMQRRMVERLRQDGVHCEPVLQAMRQWLSQPTQGASC
mgnify:CR=1 FL=1